MEFEIIEQKENLLFKRKEMQINLEAQITPSKKEIIEKIAEKFSVNPENISIKGIHGKFGSKDFTININIYSSKEDKEKTEPKEKKSGSESQIQETPQSPEQKSPANADNNLINKENKSETE